MSAWLLVTGAQGFVGRWTVAAALAEGSGRSVVGIGRSPRRDGFTHEVSLGSRRVSAPLPSALRGDEPGYRYVPVDVRDVAALADLLRSEQPSAIVHLASALRDDPSEKLFPVNVGGTIAVLQAIARSGVVVERFVLASSGSVYGQPASLPVAETQRLAPPDPYAISKVAAEEAARIITGYSAIPLVIARIFNVVGPGLDERHACARFTSQLAAIAKGWSGGPVIVGDLAPERDLVDVRDLARALVLLAERGVPGTTYNVASGRATSMQAVFDELAALTGLNHVKTVERYSRAVDAKRIVADIARVSALGYAPRYPLSASLADLYAYYAGPVASAIESAPMTDAANSSASCKRVTQG